MQCLEAIRDIIDEGSSTSYIVVGDWNANIHVGQRSLFRQPMLDFCANNNLSIVDNETCPDDSYTYVSEAHGSNTWLDHIVCTLDIRNAINNVEIAYNLTDTDHIPMCMDLNILAAPLLSEETNSCNAKLSWDSLKPIDLEKYYNSTHDFLSDIKIDSDTHLCTDLMCKNHEHKINTNNLFEGTVDAMIKASDAVFNGKGTNKCNMPLW